MSIATEFESTRENVQKAYTSLNKLGETASNKNIENISGLVDNLYNRLPKTTYQEGTNINLGKTLKAVVQYEDDKVLYGDTSQETTTGKNLLDSSTILQTTRNGITCTFNSETQEITFNGTCTTDNTLFNFPNTSFTNTYGISTLTAYYIGGSVTTFASLRFYSSTWGGNLVIDLLNLNSTNSKISETANSGYTAVNNIIRFNNGSVANNFKIKIMYANSTDTTYEKYTNGVSPNPTYPQPIQVVTGTQEVVVRGGNIFSGTRLDNLKVADLTGNDLGNYPIILKAGTYHKFIEFTDGTKWVQDIVFQFKDNANNIIVTKYTTSDFTLTEEEASQITKLQLWTNATSRELYATKTIKGLLISQEISTYEPYITPTTYQVHLGNLELAKIGTYQDYIYFDDNEGKWYKKKAIEKKIFNGSETWTLSSSWTKPNTNVFFTSSTETPNSIRNPWTDIAQIYSNYFIPTSRNLMSANDENGITFTGEQAIGRGSITIRIDNTIGTNTTTFKTWLGTHNTKLYYILATETLEEITDTTLIADLDNILAMMSVEGTTIIEVSGNLPAPIKVKAVKGE